MYAPTKAVCETAWNLRSCVTVRESAQILCVRNLHKSSEIVSLWASTKLVWGIWKNPGIVWLRALTKLVRETAQNTSNCDCVKLSSEINCLFDRHQKPFWQQIELVSFLESCKLRNLFSWKTKEFYGYLQAPFQIYGIDETICGRSYRSFWEASHWKLNKLRNPADHVTTTVVGKLNCRNLKNSKHFCVVAGLL